MRARRILDGICRVKYENNRGKLAAWLKAAHIEKAPSKKKKDDDDDGDGDPTP